MRSWIAILAAVLSACAAVSGQPTATVSPAASTSLTPSPSPYPTEAVASPGAGVAPPVGSWVMVSPMSTARLDFTATLLRDGRVLVSGGRTNAFAYAPSGSPTSSVELFNPATHQFTRAAPLGVARAGHTATLLASGKVLVAGGDGGGLGTAEVYDPAANSWATTAPMNTRRTDHAAVLLADGRVFVTGGGQSTIVGFGPQSSSPAKLATEIYNPATDAWSIAATPAYDRPVQPTATLLSDGRVLVVGGQYMDASADETVERSEIYDPKSNVWLAATPEIRAGARQFHTATTLPTGQILFAGGERDWHSTGFASAYEPRTNSWTQLPNMLENRCGPGAALLPTGLVLVAGGGCGGPEETAGAEEFDPIATRWYPVASLPTFRGSLKLVVLPTGEVLGVGGMEQAGMPTALAEIFKPS